MDTLQMAAPPKGVSENSAAKKNPPLKEVWWDSLSQLGKHAAFCEALNLDPRRVPEVCEAIGVAFLRWAGVTVHLEKKPLSAQVDAREVAT